MQVVHVHVWAGLIVQIELSLAIWHIQNGTFATTVMLIVVLGFGHHSVCTALVTTPYLIHTASCVAVVYALSHRAMNQAQTVTFWLQPVVYSDDNRVILGLSQPT